MSCEGRTTLARGVGCRTSNIPQLRFSFGRDNGTGDDRSLASSHMASRAVVGTLRRGLSRGRRAPPAAVGSSDVARDARDPFEPLGSRWRELEHVRRDWAHRRPTTSRGEESGFGAGWEVRRAFSSSSAAFTSGRDARKDIDDETSSSSSSSSSPVAEAGAPTGPRVHSDSSMWDVAGFLGENRRVAGICVTTALLMAGHSCVAPVLPMFAEEFGASAAQVGATLSAFALARLVLNVPFGALADSRGRKPLMVAGPLITAAGMLGSAQCEWGGLPELFFWRFVAGAGSAAYAAGAQATLADLSHRSNRARVLGANQAAVLAGAAFGPVVGGFISGAPMELGVRAPFAAVGATCALAGWHAAATAPETLRDATNFGRRNSNGTETRPKTAATEDGEAEREVAAAATGDVNVASSAGDEEGAIGASEDRGGENAETSLRETLRRRDFLAVSGLNAALFFSGAGGRATLLPLLAVQEHGYTPAGLGALFTAMAATSALGIGPGAFLSDSFGRTKVIAPCVAASAVAVAVVGTATDPNVFLGAAIAWALAHSLMGPAPAAYATEVSPERGRAVALSAYRTFGDVGLLVGPVALGALADCVGVGPALAANGGVLAASALAFTAAARGEGARTRDNR